MHSYFQKIQQLLEKVIRDEQEAITEAAELIAGRIGKGGILQLFGCGHSHLLAQEAYYRAGGLVPVQPIMLEPIMLHVGALTSSQNEKDASFIPNHLDAFDFK